MTEDDQRPADWPTTRSDLNINRLDLLTQGAARLEAGSLNTVTHAVMREVLRLWSEVVSTTSLRRVPDPAQRRPGGWDNDRSYLDNADSRRVDQGIEVAVEVDLLDEKAMRAATLVSLECLLDTLNATASSRSVLLSDHGVEIDPAPYRSMWYSRIHLLHGTQVVVPFIDEVRDRTASTLQGVTMETALAQTALDDTLAKLQELRDELAEARAEEAQNELATHFGNLADTERKVSNNFRWLAFGLIIFAAAFTALTTRADTWWEAGGHVALAASFGAASAYAARLGATHRHTADWAQSVKVQLDTFKGFVAELEQTTRERVYEEFSRRVLGAPPSFSSNGNEPAPLPTAQIIELASALSRLRQTPPTG